ncbi:hypothetical protein COOONC_20705 [Cooperia oncophora]
MGTVGCQAQPKDEETNKLQYLREFPWFANESCDQVKNSLPVVDCPNSVCIKAVITEPPAKRDVKLSEDDDANRILGTIYICRGFLCNASSPSVQITQLLALPLLLVLLGTVALQNVALL